MKRFVECDDEIEYVEQTASVLHELYDACSVEHMYGPDALEASLREDSSGADVLLTEIELRGKNSIELIKKWLKPSSPLQIIYLTKYIHYCTDVYDTKHSSFLVKPVTPEKLRHAINIAFSALEKDRIAGITVKTNGGTRIIYIPSLLYVESHGRRLCLISDQEQIETYEKMTDFCTDLDCRFLLCHKSYLINMDHVRQYCGNSFLMDNGEHIPISQTRRKYAKLTFAHYMKSE